MYIGKLKKISQTVRIIGPVHIIETYEYLVKTISTILFYIWTLSGRPKSPSIQVYHVIRLNTRATSVILSPHTSQSKTALFRC